MLIRGIFGYKYYKWVIWTLHIYISADFGGNMNDAIISYFDFVFQGIIGILVIIGLFISPKRRPTDKEIIEDLRIKLKRQGGMLIESQAGSANLSAAYDTQEKRYQREFHLLEEKHNKEMEEERRKRPPIKMP